MDHGCKTYVVSREVMNRGLGQHAVVLELRLAERGCVAGDDDLKFVSDMFHLQIERTS